MPTPRVLVVDDEHLIRWSLEQHLEKNGYEVITTSNGREAVQIVQDALPEAVLLDIQMPGMDGIEVLRAIREIDPDVPVVMITAHGGVGSAVAAMKLGAYDYVEKPFDIQRITVLLANALERRTLKGEVTRFRSEQGRRYGLDRMVGESPSIRTVKETIEKIARTDAATVLLQGETGTGKDLAAKIVHYQSARGEFPFVEINCSALPETLVESELFGHERGAYTDAKTMRRGLFELADGGTVFLDEIGDMPLGLQPKLLKAIEEKTFRRIGSARDIRVDVRVIAATNKNLAELARARAFREDLFYRLNVIPLRLPALRERREDVPLLVRHFVDAFSRECRKPVRGVDPSAERLLAAYDWPGNVRELRNVIERAIILENAQFILPAHLPPEIASPGPPAPEARGTIVVTEQGVSLEEVEKELIGQALKLAAGNQVKAARLLHLTRDVLRYRMKKYGYL
ncbi:MAG: sigma-54-dependent Fis family transcriptional regulator [Nitrospirae bacterium]|nr:sigma-54-dependent Fis family transcriptional regulator [Nitrospirota bacterium]